MVQKKIFVAASYSSQVNYKTRSVKEEYKSWLEDILNELEKYGHQVFVLLGLTNIKLMIQIQRLLFILTANISNSQIFCSHSWILIRPVASKLKSVWLWR